MSQEANKLQMPFSANSIYSRDPISKMSINCRSPFSASNKSTSLDINYTQSEINDSNMWNRKTSPCSPCAPTLLHVLPSRMVGWNKLFNPVY